MEEKDTEEKGKRNNIDQNSNLPNRTETLKCTDTTPSKISIIPTNNEPHDNPISTCNNLSGTYYTIPNKYHNYYNHIYSWHLCPDTFQRMDVLRKTKTQHTSYPIMQNPPNTPTLQ